MKRALGFLVIVGGALLAVFAVLLFAGFLADKDKSGLEVYVAPAFALVVLAARFVPYVFDWFTYRKGQKEIQDLGGLSHFARPQESHFARRRRRPSMDADFFPDGKKFSFEIPFFEVAGALKKALLKNENEACKWKIGPAENTASLTGPFWTLTFKIRSGRYNLLALDMVLSINETAFDQGALSWWLWGRGVTFPGRLIAANKRGLAKAAKLVGETFDAHLAPYLFHEKNALAALTAAQKELETMEQGIEKFLKEEMDAGKVPSPENPIAIPETLAPIFQWAVAVDELFWDIAKTR